MFEPLAYAVEIGKALAYCTLGALVASCVWSSEVQKYYRLSCRLMHQGEEE